MLKVVHLCKTVNNKKILNDFQFEVEEGEIAIFLGGSGAGKTTFLRVMNHLDYCDQGSIVFNGIDLNLKQAHHPMVGLVFQHFNLFEHLNAIENITLALIHCKGMIKTEAEAIAYNLLDQYELRDQALHQIHQLSGGQKQRLAIARTLALDPKIICMDEPSSALDLRLTGQLACIINKLTDEKRIVLLATHDMKLLELLDGKIFLVENGSIVESTSKSHFLSNPTSYPKLQKFLKV